MTARPPKTVLLTGFPTSFVAWKLLEKTLAAEPESSVRCLTPAKLLDEAEAKLSELAPDRRARVELVEGDPSAMDFGMSGKRYLELADEIDVVHHAAAVSFPGVDRATAERVNLGGAVEALEFAEACKHLQRLVLWSTTSVSGTLEGRLREGELPRPPRFRNVVEETRFLAEKVVRQSMDHLPTTILRPSIIVGDSRTGEIDRFDGPYLLVLLMLNSPVDLRMPLPGRGDSPLPLVPIDYVIEAADAIVHDPRSIGRTFHLVDPRPVPTRRVFELIAEAAGRPGPVGSLPTHLAATVLRTPGLERFSHIPRAFLEQLATDVTYDARNAEELLAEHDIRCPPVQDYIPTLVGYVRAEQARRAQEREQASEPPEEELAEAEDPLA